MQVKAVGVALALLVSLSSPARAQETFAGDWDLRMASERQPGVPTAHVTLRTGGMNTFDIPVDRLEGLTAEQVAQSDGPARFRLREDAGTFTFSGSFRGGRGTGRFEFAPDPAFATALQRRGMERPTPAQQFSLARHRVGLDFLAELAAQRYAQPSTETMVSAGVHGANLQYLREMAAVGYRVGTVEELIRMRNHAVTGHFVRTMAEQGYRNLPASEAMQAATQNVTAAYVRELARLGYRGLSLGELVRLRVHNVNPEFAQRMNTREGRRLSVGELVHLRSRGAR